LLRFSPLSQKIDYASAAAAAASVSRRRFAIAGFRDFLSPQPRRFHFIAASRFQTSMSFSAFSRFSLLRRLRLHFSFR